MSIERKAILITGATDGIGELTAHKLAAEGYNVLLHGRNEQKLNRVAQEIKKASKNENIEEYVADFSSLENVRQLARKVKNDHPSLHILINNAGLGFSDVRELSDDGYELRFAVNYLAPFLLTNLLLPNLQLGSGTRIVNVASAGQQPIDFENIFLESDYEAWRAYRQSKLALIMFTFSLAEKLKNDNIVVNALHPGTFLNTKMVNDAGITPQGKPESGAEAITYLALSPQLKEISGKYFNEKSEAKADEQAYDPEIREKLWKLSEKYTNL